MSAGHQGKDVWMREAAASTVLSGHNTILIKGDKFEVTRKNFLSFKRPRETGTDGR